MMYDYSICWLWIRLKSRHSQNFQFFFSFRTEISWYDIYFFLHARRSKEDSFWVWLRYEAFHDWIYILRPLTFRNIEIFCKRWTPFLELRSYDELLALIVLDVHKLRYFCRRPKPLPSTFDLGLIHRLEINYEKVICKSLFSVRNQ